MQTPTIPLLIALLLLLPGGALFGEEAPGFGPDFVSSPRKPAPSSAPREVELHFSLTAKARHWMVDSDIKAGGTLLMQATPRSRGGQSYSLIRPLVQPWKFYWADLPGFLPTLVWGGTTYVVEKPGAEAQKAVDSKAEKFIQKIYQRWRTEGGKDEELDGNDSYYVFGSPRGRLSFQTGPNGQIQGEIHNEMTGKWTPRALKRWLSGKLRQGYGNASGDSEPPEGEAPHTYHALVRALKVYLGRPLLDKGSLAKLAPGDRLQVSSVGVAEGTAEILRTLMPKVDEHPKFLPKPTPLSLEVTQAYPGSLLLSGNSGKEEIDLGDGFVGRILRRTRFQAQSHMVEADEFMVEMSRNKGKSNSLEITIRIGYGSW
jgi:hypothetical protein